MPSKSDPNENTAGTASHILRFPTKLNTKLSLGKHPQIRNLLRKARVLSQIRSQMLLKTYQAMHTWK